MKLFIEAFRVQQNFQKRYLSVLIKRKLRKNLLVNTWMPKMIFAILSKRIKFVKNLTGCAKKYVSVFKFVYRFLRQNDDYSCPYKQIWQ